MTSSTRRVEALVIGGGPAGAAAAIELARAGADVLLVERRSFPRPKVCGGCLGPRAIACLHQLGLEPALIDGAIRLNKVRVHVAGAQAELPLPQGLAVDRAEFDQRLLALVRVQGADVWSAARARIGELSSAGRSVRVELKDGVQTVIARVVVLATGLPSSPASAPGARIGLSQTRSVTGMLSGPPEGEVWMVSGSLGYIGMVRFAEGRLNVAASIPASALADSTPSVRVDEVLIEAGLPPLRWHDGWTGTPPLRAHPPEIVEERVLPVGDAAGFWEPFTGEGIGWGLEAGIAVAPVAVDLGRNWDPRGAAAWLRERQAWMCKVQTRSRTVAAISARPRIARAALGLIRTVPAAGQWLIPAAPTGGGPDQRPGAARGVA